MWKDLRDSTLYEDCYRFKERRSNLRFFSVLFVIVFVFLGLRGYWVHNFGGVEVDGASMNKTLYSTEQLLVRYVKDGKGIERGDIVVVYVENYPEIQKENAGKREEDKLKYLIKRLIAVEGDTVRCTDGQISIRYAGTEEFVELDEPYAYYSTDKGRAEYDFKKDYVVGEGEIFFLGDNRCNSIDSRYNESYYTASGVKRCSHLPDRLYKATDVFGVVPEWAVEHQAILEKIFF